MLLCCLAKFWTLICVFVSLWHSEYLDIDMNIDINIDIHIQFGFITPEINISEAMMLLYIVKIDLLWLILNWYMFTI